MPGIFPDTSNGGVVTRDGTTCLTPSSVTNAYCPGPDFSTSCNITMLPSDCTARITPAQINAITSELLSFAECLDPDGTWTCGSLNNLCTAFTAWAAENDVTADGTTIDGAGTPVSPFTLNALGAVNRICTTPPARAALIDCVLSADAGNIIVEAPGDGGLFAQTDPDVTVAQICADADARTALVACVLSQEPTNATVVSLVDGGLLTPQQHLLFGEFGRSDASIPVVPAVNGSTNFIAGETFTIPNTSNRPVTIQMQVEQHNILRASPGEGAYAGYNVHDGIDETGAIIAGTHSSTEMTAGNRVSSDQFNSRSESGILIPPGGRTFFLGFYAGMSGAAGGGTVDAPAAGVSWYGVTADTFN